MTGPEKSTASPGGNPPDLQPAAQSDPVTAGSDNTSSPTLPSSSPIPKLTPEEQLALYEKELKENDWGHQPC